jgi:hypothetical protein
MDRIVNPNALIDPDAPALEPLIEELRPLFAEGPSPREALKHVERFVYLKIPYEWDWITWGVSDYWPTVDEAMRAGREDCDGRAVVAASLLRAFGMEARLVTNFAHVWVETPHGDTMSPAGKKAVVATEDGVHMNWSALGEAPLSAAYGMAVFPFGRQLIVVGVLWWLLIGKASARRSVLALLLLTFGLLAIRWLCADYFAIRLYSPAPGFAMIALGMILMLLPWRRKKATQSFLDPAPSVPGSRASLL